MIWLTRHYRAFRQWWPLAWKRPLLDQIESLKRELDVMDQIRADAVQDAADAHADRRMAEKATIDVAAVAPSPVAGVES